MNATTKKITQSVSKKDNSKEVRIIIETENNKEFALQAIIKCEIEETHENFSQKSD